MNSATQRTGHRPAGAASATGHTRRSAPEQRVATTDVVDITALGAEWRCLTTRTLTKTPAPQFGAAERISLVRPDPARGENAWSRVPLNIAGAYVGEVLSAHTLPGNAPVTEYRFSEENSIDASDPTMLASTYLLYAELPSLVRVHTLTLLTTFEQRVMLDEALPEALPSLFATIPMQMWHAFDSIAWQEPAMFEAAAATPTDPRHLTFPLSERPEGLLMTAFAKHALEKPHRLPSSLDSWIAACALLDGRMPEGTTGTTWLEHAGHCMLNAWRHPGPFAEHFPWRTRLFRALGALA